MRVPFLFFAFVAISTLFGCRTDEPSSIEKTPDSDGQKTVLPLDTSNLSLTLVPLECVEADSLLHSLHAQLQDPARFEKGYVRRDILQPNRHDGSRIDTIRTYTRGNTFVQYYLNTDGKVLVQCALLGQEFPLHSLLLRQAFPSSLWKDSVLYCDHEQTLKLYGYLKADTLYSVRFVGYVD